MSFVIAIFQWNCNIFHSNKTCKTTLVGQESQQCKPNLARNRSFSIDNQTNLLPLPGNLCGKQKLSSNQEKVKENSRFSDLENTSSEKKRLVSGIARPLSVPFLICTSHSQAGSARHCPNYLPPLPPVRASCTTMSKRRFDAYYRTN